ncbi:MAG: hypothetical protein V1705_02175 [bacterium]
MTQDKSYTSPTNSNGDEGFEVNIPEEELDAEFDGDMPEEMAELEEEMGSDEAGEELE